jgi:hypothetical protein
VATSLSIFGTPQTAQGLFAPKAQAGLPAFGIAVDEFDVWRPGYAGAAVLVVQAGTTAKAPLFSDPGLTVPAENPQALLIFTDEQNRTYGKWAAPIYTSVPYSLQINAIDETSVRRPGVVSLSGEDASLAMAATRRGGFARSLRDWLDDDIRAAAFGGLGVSPAANTAIIEMAIGAAGAAGGGSVILPAGSFEILTLTLPARVVLVGQGRNATTLRSMQAQPIISLGGVACGLRDLTLDGVNVIPASVGVFGVNARETLLDRIEIKRFDIGVLCKGGTKNRWDKMFVTNCNRGADLFGDVNAGQTVAGGPWADNVWSGGEVSFCTANGCNIEYRDDQATDMTFEQVAFHHNAATGLRLEGAQAVALYGCQFYDNIRNLEVQDDTDTSRRPLNTTVDLYGEGCWMLGGDVRFSGACSDVQFFRCDFADVDWRLDAPDEVILLRDCAEDALTTVIGEGTKLMRFNQHSEGSVSGITTDGTPITAWERALEPGEVGLAEARVIARRRNGTDYAIYHIQVGAQRPAASLTYDNETATFTVGQIVTGQSSGAAARIVALTDNGVSGSISLRDIDGTFQNAEIITDGLGGSARVDGSLSVQNAALDSGGVTVQRAAVETTASYDCTFSVSNEKIRLRVTGAAAHTVEWTAEVRWMVP